MVIKLNQLLTKLIIFCATAMLMFTGVLGIGVTKYFTFAIIAFCFSKALFLHLKPMQFCLLMAIAISSVFTILLQKGETVYLFIFTGSLILELTLCRDGIDSGSWKVLKVCSVVVAAWFIFLFFFDPSAMQFGKLYYSFDNPNMTGISLCGFGMILVLMASEERKLPGKLLRYAVVAMTIFLVYLTENRGSFFTLILMVAAALLTTLPRKPIRITSDLVYTLLKLLPILILFIYVILYSVLPHDLRLMDKPFFSGREKDWQIALTQLLSDPFSYHRFEDGTLNLFLQGSVLYGLVAMVGYFWLLFTIKKPDLKSISNTRYLAYLGFHLCFIQQSFESTLVTGSYNIYIWSYMLLGIAFMKQEPTPADVSIPLQ